MSGHYDTAEQADHSNACVRCGNAPWGHGYCGELCKRCAADDEAEDERQAYVEKVEQGWTRRSYEDDAYGYHYPEV